MAKDKARGEQSYRNEEVLLSLLPAVFIGHGFSDAVATRSGQMKFLDARRFDGSVVRFWVKQGWTTTRTFSAIQFGMIKDPDPRQLPASHFKDYVAKRVQAAKSNGASHAVLVHMVDAQITNYVAMPIDDVSHAFNDQIAKWPNRVRNNKTPTLYFEDSRDLPEAACVQTVIDRDVPLEQLARVADDEAALPQPGYMAAKKITAEIELRMLQQAFRLSVGERCGWRCVVSGVAVREVLDAAHLPGKDWRFDNRPDDGVLLRADLHRLLDRGLAQIKGGKFLIAKKLRTSEYQAFHDRSVTPAST